MYRRWIGPPMKNGPEPAFRFIAASFSRCACTSCSLMPAPIPRRGARASLGIAPNSSSTFFTPMRASIAARSAAVCGEYGLRFVTDVGRASSVSAGARRLADVRAVVLRGQELLQLALVGELHPHHPAVAIRLRVHELRLLDDLHVALQHLARDGAVDIGGGLHRLHHTEARELADRRALLGQLDEDDIAQLLLREVGDPDRGGIAVETDPLVLLRVAQVLRNGHFSLLL